MLEAALAPRLFHGDDVVLLVAYDVLAPPTTMITESCASQCHCRHHNDSDNVIVIGMRLSSLLYCRSYAFLNIIDVEARD